MQALQGAAPGITDELPAGSEEVIPEESLLSEGMEVK